VRGWPDAEGVIDHPLPDVRERSPRKDAITHWRTLATATVPIAIGKYPEQRDALVEAIPKSGRYRQIRKHFHHVSHHIIGDTSHGRGDHNRLWRIHFGVHRLMLHAWRLELAHPLSGKSVALCAPPDQVWRGVLERFGWSACVAAGERADC
jgi:tRNA pseudouridine65 synthase